MFLDVVSPSNGLRTRDVRTLVKVTILPKGSAGRFLHVLLPCFWLKRGATLWWAVYENYTWCFDYLGVMTRWRYSGWRSFHWWLRDVRRDWRYFVWHLQYYFCRTNCCLGFLQFRVYFHSAARNVSYRYLSSFWDNPRNIAKQFRSTSQIILCVGFALTPTIKNWWIIPLMYLLNVSHRLEIQIIVAFPGPRHKHKPYFKQQNSVDLVRLFQRRSMQNRLGRICWFCFDPR